MSSIKVRGHKLYAKIKCPDGVWREFATGLNVDQRDAALRWIADRERKVASARAELDPGFKPMTVERFATSWLAKRTNVTAKDNTASITKHVVPRIGRLPMSDVRPKHIDDLIMALRDEGKLAPRTIRSLSGLLHTMFKRAVKEEAIATNPVQMERGTLPKKVDKDPTWRSEAIYTRDEAELVISDERIPADRRVFVALKFLGGGMRHGEAARLTWRNYDAAQMPLGRIALGKTKSGVPREVPVHPTLARVLAEWKLGGWERTFGRSPQPEDLIVPTRNFTERDATESQRQLVADLKLLGLRTKAGATRQRRGHDFRRTFISLARADGALDGPLHWVTHGPSASSMSDLYSTFPWATLCAEVAKLKIDVREGKVIEMPKVAIAGGSASGPHDDRGAVMVQPAQNASNRRTAAVYERPRRDSKESFRADDGDPQQESPSLGVVEMLPSARENGLTAPRLVQSVDPVDEAIAAVERALVVDAKRTRRALLRLLTELE